MKKALNNKRYGGIDLLKHILAIFVIWHHMQSKSRYSLETNLFIEDVTSYMNGAVIGFFFISGFFFRYHQNLQISIVKIFKRTMIPFFVFSILYSVILSLLKKEELLASLLNTIYLKGSGMQLYYLSYLFFIYSFFLLLHNFFSKHNRIYITIIIFLIVVFTGLAISFPTNNATGNNYQLIFIYSLSFGIAVLLSLLKKQKPDFFLIVSIMLIFTSLLIGIIDFRFYHIGAMILLFIVALNLSRFTGFFSSAIPGSGGIYLMHTPIVNFSISTLLLHLYISEIQNVIFTVILTYFMTLGLTILFIKQFPKYKFVLLE